MWVLRTAASDIPASFSFQILSSPLTSFTEETAAEKPKGEKKAQDHYGKYLWPFLRPGARERCFDQREAAAGT
ncbi:unnamed protein product [Caretta caretta]